VQANLVGKSLLHYASGYMKTRYLAAAFSVCLFVSAFAAGQGSLLINDPTAADAPGAISSDNKYKLSATEQAAMDKYVFPKARIKLKESCGDEEAIEIAGRQQGSFTKAGADQTLIFYQFCQTGNGLGTAGVTILEAGRPVANFVAPNSGWTMDSAVLPDINQNGLDEIALYYSGGMHQGEGGTGVDIFEYSAGGLKGIGWYQSDGFSETGPVFGYKVTVNPGKTPAFFKQKYLQNAAGKWRISGKALPLKLTEVIGTFEPLK
jgi:hypothetical protein